MSRASLLIATLGLCAQAQHTPAKEAQPIEAKGLPPRAAPTDYQAQAKAGNVTIAAEFKGHAVPTEEATFTAEEYVVVEVGLFGPPDAKTRMTTDDFSLRINGKKTALPSQPYELAFKSLKDPEWAPPAPAEGKSKTSFGSGGGGGGAGDNGPPPVVHMPMDLQRAMQQKVQRAALLEGDRALPQAGLIFFQYRGKVEGIHSIELIYSGAAGKAILALQP
ncbi:MAG TPA: hypothetical protein VEU96_33435 [Bryobacteraceae bacterium]|nr:hypothetical protein [Bryobacteraceae bacterium]